MRKLGFALIVLGLAASATFGLSACGSASGKEGGTLTASYASPPEFLDPGLNYSSEGATAMYDTYIPLLTYAHDEGVAGSKLVPGLAEDLPKISDGGKTYTLTLRKGLKYSDGKPVKASDFASTIERDFEISSPYSSFLENIVGAEEFAATKKGGIPGIETNDKTGEIVIKLVKPQSTLSNVLGLLVAAPVPAGTPAKPLTANPAPATGPYEIVDSKPGRSWSYERNPQWEKANAELVPDVPSGHVDRIDVTVIRNDSTQVDQVEQGKTDWMQPPPPADRYTEVKDKYEGTQFRIEPTVSTYYFWMNMQQPPFDDLKVRQAVNYAVNPEALERIYSGQITATHQILPPGMPGYEKYDLYPHSMSKAKKLIAEANPSDRNITVWTNNESPNDEAGAYYQRVLTNLGFNAKLKEINGENYFGVIGNRSTPDLDTGFFNWFEDFPHPDDFFGPLLNGESIEPTFNFNLSQTDIPALNEKIVKLSEEPLGSEQEAEYAKLDEEFMKEAPWVPYGTRTNSLFVSSSVDLDKVIWNPTFGADLTSFQLK